MKTSEVRRYKMRLYNATHRAEIAAKTKAYRRANAEHIRQVRNAYLARKKAEQQAAQSATTEGGSK